MTATTIDSRFDKPCVRGIKRYTELSFKKGHLHLAFWREIAQTLVKIKLFSVHVSSVCVCARYQMQCTLKDYMFGCTQSFAFMSKLKYTIEACFCYRIKKM